MKANSLYLVLLLGTLFSFSSCTGQEKKDSAPPLAEQKNRNLISHQLDEKIWTIYQDKNNNYWFGSNGRGVYFYDGKKVRQFTEKDGLIDNYVRGIQEDKAGNIYIETPKGVSQWKDNVFNTLTPILSSSNDWKLESDDLWFNCNGNLEDVYRYDGNLLYLLKLPRHNLIETFDLKPEDLRFNPYTTYGIDKDKKGNIWFGTLLAGAFRFDGEEFLWFPEKELSQLDDGRVPGVRSILEDTEGYIWLSNFISKYKIDEDESSYQKTIGIPKSNEYFKSRIPYFNSGLADAKNGDLWMTTYTGGVWKKEGENLKNFPVMDGDKKVLLVSIYQDNQGVLWLGTDNAGVYRFNGFSFKRFIL